MDFEEGVEYRSRLIFKNIEDTNLNKIGLCTGWNQPGIYKDVNANVIGPLYSRSGADLMLRNIFRCPNIVGLIILDTNELGTNSMGRAGLAHIRNLFFNTNIKDTTPYDMSILETFQVYYITKNIIEMKQGRYRYTSSAPSVIEDSLLNSLMDRMRNGVFTARNQIIYKSPESLLDKPLEMNTCHETHGTCFNGSSLVDAWIMALGYVYKFGTDNKTLRQFHSVHWSFESSTADTSLEALRSFITQDDIQKLLCITVDGLKDYTRTIIDGSEVPNVSYTYGQRIRQYEIQILASLSSDKDSRHAYATTIKAPSLHMDDAPCLVYIQFLYEPIDNKLNLYCVFRSHDMLKAAAANAFALVQLLRYYCTKLDMTPGIVEITSISAHIYINNLSHAHLFLECVSKLWKDQIRMDPRGYATIERPDPSTDIIHFQLHDNKTGAIKFQMNDTGVNIYKEILEQKVIIDPEHLRYLFQELMFKK